MRKHPEARAGKELWWLCEAGASVRPECTTKGNRGLDSSARVGEREAIERASGSQQKIREGSWAAGPFPLLFFGACQVGESRLRYASFAPAFSWVRSYVSRVTHVEPLRITPCGANKTVTGSLAV